MEVLKEAEKYRDKRLVENLVVKSVMEYVRIYGMENTEGMDRIFRKRVRRADYVAEYQRVYDANKVLFKGQPAVPFTFKDITGKEVSLSDLKGKYVYIDVWATWCGPCNAEIPHLRKLEEEFEGRNTATACRGPHGRRSPARGAPAGWAPDGPPPAAWSPAAGLPRDHGPQEPAQRGNHQTFCPS